MIAGVGRDLALLVALFVQPAIDRAAVLDDQSADHAELVAAVAVEVHDPRQGEVVLLARRPERGEDLVAGHDRIGELVVEDAGLGRVIAVDARDLDRGLLDGLGDVGRVGRVDGEFRLPLQGVRPAAVDPDRLVRQADPGDFTRGDVRVLVRLLRFFSRSSADFCISRSLLLYRVLSIPLGLSSLVDSAAALALNLCRSATLLLSVSSEAVI